MTSVLGGMFALVGGPGELWCLFYYDNFVKYSLHWSFMAKLVIFVLLCIPSGQNMWSEYVVTFQDMNYDLYISV